MKVEIVFHLLFGPANHPSVFSWVRAMESWLIEWNGVECNVRKQKYSVHLKWNDMTLIFINNYNFGWKRVFCLRENWKTQTKRRICRCAPLSSASQSVCSWFLRKRNGNPFTSKWVMKTEGTFGKFWWWFGMEMVCRREVYFNERPFIEVKVVLLYDYHHDYLRRISGSHFRGIILFLVFSFL